jgi:neurotransmitter:Na+ symporter, NSS family
MAIANLTWTTRATFLLAAIGAAVGLGNVWRFPYLAGTSGGGAFVIVYLGCVMAIAIPILIAELMLGRRGRGSPPAAMARIAIESGRSQAWSVVGWLGAWSGFLIVSFYSVIGGWAIHYVGVTLSGAFQGANGARSEALFTHLQGSPWIMTGWHTAFMAFTVVIVARGLNRGIEAAVRLLMPALFAMLLVMVGYAAMAGDLGGGWRFLFGFAPDAVTGQVVLLAIGQAFFSIGVAMGLMMMYGAYLPSDQPIPRYAVIIALADTLVALLAGLAIFPLVFAHGLDPAQGPGLIFVTLPVAFGNMPLGTVFGGMFFLLLVFAAVTSAIALIQPMVARVGELPAMTSGRAALLVGAAAWLLGIASVLSFNHWADVAPLAWLPGAGSRTAYELLDFVTANLLMPLGGVLIAVFAGWLIPDRVLSEALPGWRSGSFRLWRVAVRYLAPLAILAVFVANLR